MSDIETRLTTMLRARADEIDFDPAEWTARIASAPAPRRRRYAAALAAAAALVGVVVLGTSLRTDRDATPPASNTVATTAPRNGRLAGVWRLTWLGGAPVTQRPGSREPRLIIAENGWWRAEAGCVAVGSWLTWDPGSGRVEVEDWSPSSGPLPPTDLADCYRPEILAVVRPGTTWTPGTDDIVVRDQQGEQFARLARTEDALVLRAQDLRTPEGHPWRLVASANLRQDGPELGGLVGALGRNPAPWLRVTIVPAGERVAVTLLRPAGTAPACTLARLDAQADRSGRLSEVRTGTAPGGDGTCREVYPAERRATAAIGATRALARGDEGRYLLGEHGAVIAFAAEIAGTPSLSGPALVTDAALLRGEWHVESDEPGPDPVVVHFGPEGDATVSVNVLSTCGRLVRELRLDDAGRVLRNAVSGASDGACLAADDAAPPLFGVLANARALYLDQGRLWIDGGGSGWATLTDAPPLPPGAPAPPLLSRYAAPVDLVGNWRQTWSRHDPAKPPRTEAAVLQLRQAADGALRLTYDECNALTGQIQLSGDGWIWRADIGTTLVGCPPATAWVEARLIDAAAYGISTRGELLLLSRGGEPLLAFARAG